MKATRPVRDASVRVQDVSMTELESACRNLLGIVPARDRPVLGFWFELFDATDAYAQADKIMADLGKTESHPFYQSFDIRPFAVSLEITPQDPIDAEGAVLPIAEALARLLSRRLKKKIVVVFNSGNVPYRLYDSGKLIEDYRQFYGEYVDP